MKPTLASAVLILAFSVLGAQVVAQQVTTGAIEGTVIGPDESPLPNATVTVTSKEGAKSTTTSANGVFRFPYLSVGEYDLKVKLDGYNTVEQPSLAVKLGGRVQVVVTLSPAVAERVDVVATAPAIDVSSATIGTNVSTDFLASIPVNRTFSSAIELAPGVVPGGLDESNPSINGASGLENTVYIDGVNIANTGFGSAGSFSYVMGTLGTGVNFDYLEEIQVKTGGYEPEYGEALGGYVNVVTKSGGNKIAGTGYAYAQSRKLEADRASTDRNNAVSDPRGFESLDYGFSLGGPFVRDKAFWFAAFNPTFQTFTRRTPLATRKALGFDHELDLERTIYNYAVNVKWLAHPKHTISVSSFGDPSVGDNGPQRPDAVAVEDPTRKHSKLTFGGYNAVGRWEGEILPNWYGEGSIAYHRDVFEEDLAVNEPEGVDFRTAVPLRYGGVGFFTNSESSNFQYRLRLSNFVHRAGQHHLRYGIEYQDIGYDNTTNYSGRPGLVLPDGKIATSGYQWYIPDSTTFRVGRVRSDELTVETKADYLAFFISDTWTPIKSLNIMAGVRYEQETLKGTLSDFTWDNNWAPRAHITWDPTQDGKSKLAFAFGRFFGKVPNDLAVRALSGEVTYVIIYPISNVDLSNPNNPVILDPNNVIDYFVFGDHPTRVDDKAKLTYQDEYVLSGERELRPLWKAGVSYLHRRLGRTLEDVALVPYSDILSGAADFGEYFITNPTPEMGFPTPSRKYNAVTVSVEKRLNPAANQPGAATSPLDNVQLAAAYTWSRLKGNYEGYYRRDNGQPDPFITSLFDFPYLRDPDIFEFLISDQLLPNDRTHTVNLYGSYRFPFKLTLGTNLKILSGNPITRLGFNEVYSNSLEIPLEERGASGRSPAIYDWGLHGDYPIELRGGGKLHLVVNVFNLLGHQKATDIDQEYERSFRGDVNPDFGKPLAFQAPRQFQLAARYEF